MTTSSELSRETALATVTAYLSAIQSGTAAEIADLFHGEAALNDPAGSTPVAGRDSIVDFYAPLTATKRETELLAFRHSGPAAAFLFTVRTFLDDGKIVEISPIDVMTIHADGLIISTTAFWSKEDMRLA